MRLWAKICANTSLADARLAAEAGADAVGFVFAPSPRIVTAEQVAAIVPHLPPSLEKIGVFVDASFAEIESTVAACGLTGVQLHFNAPAELPARLRARFGPALRILRVVHFRAETVGRITEKSSFVSGHDFKPALSLPKGAESRQKSTGALAPAPFSDPNVDAILVDSFSAQAAGGAGVAFDWDAAAALFRNAFERRLVAAGGLTPANVAQAIALLRPWGVDVVSGVEAAPGRKDPDKVRAFLARARGKLGPGT